MSEKEFEPRLGKIGHTKSATPKTFAKQVLIVAYKNGFKTLKAELIWRHTWATRQQVSNALFQYINGFYNTRRKHSAIGGTSPVKFERISA